MADPLENNIEPIEDPDADVSDRDFFLGAFDDETEPEKVSRDVARDDFLRVLRLWKCAKKVKKRLHSKDKEIREGVEENLEFVLDAIQDGSLVVEKAGPFGVKLVHKLNVPLKSISGEVLLDQLEYKRVPRVVDLRKMDQFDEKEQVAKLQALAAAMSGRDVNELANLSGTDVDVLGAMITFFV
jgi:hypothetical protein